MVEVVETRRGSALEEEEVEVVVGKAGERERRLLYRWREWGTVAARHTTRMSSKIVGWAKKVVKQREYANGVDDNDGGGRGREGLWIVSETV